MMAKPIQVEAARIPDRDRLLKTLMLHGHDARPVNEVGIAVHYGLGDDDPSDDVYGQVEDVVIALGEPFVPMKHEGVIYLRPPIG